MELDYFLESILKSVKCLNMHIEKISTNYNDPEVLSHLNREVLILEGKIKKFSKGSQVKAAEMPPINSIVESQDINKVQPTKAISREELAMNNGMDGNPAYVAINGFVYDVTKSPAWAAASHFGLRAGNDLTDEFESCHAGENILEKLPIVGFLS
ncbi:cytochrome b5 domain-containing protein [Anaerotignum sp.]|uniref:cytochrome b5 domain-containing protein n=1 Tax=Anaerotignum sp. TaxID=2039241 RepID=UPI0027150B17|nr:cytochrome b5 domain-containing protein [Anaerotignum sp.]